MNSRILMFLVVLTVCHLAAADPSASLNHTEITLIEQQSNSSELTESVSPTAGYPWDWQASALSGFSGAPSVWFTYEDEGSGKPNENHTDALLHWSGLVSSDWNNGVNSTFTLSLSNGYDSDIVYSMNLSLWSLVGDGYTVIAGQTQGEAGVSALGAHGFFITVTDPPPCP